MINNIAYTLRKLIKYSIHKEYYFQLLILNIIIVVRFYEASYSTGTVIQLILETVQQVLL